MNNKPSTNFQFQRRTIQEGTVSPADTTRENYSPIFVNGEWRQQKSTFYPPIYGIAYKRSLHGPIRKV